MSLDELFRHLDESYVQHHVLAPHDEARRRFQLLSHTARDAQEFKAIVAQYVQHLRAALGDRVPSENSAFAEAKQMLGRLFHGFPRQDGYENALAKGMRGEMEEVINQLAIGLKDHALDLHVDCLYYSTIDPASTEENRHLAAALHQRYGTTLRASDEALRRLVNHLPPFFRDF